MGVKMSRLARLMVIGTYILFLIPFYGITLNTLWEWFITPTFHVPPINYIQADGICLLIMMLTYRVPYPKKEELEVLDYLFYHFVNTITYLSLFLFGGWIFHFYM